MKRSYKLLGVEWDHAPLPKECPVFIAERDIQNWREERNLFDLEKYQRLIPVSEILSIKSLDELEPVIKSVKDCDQVVIELDYEPKTQASIIVTFYTLRVMQMYKYFQQKLEGIPVCFAGSDRMKIQCENLIAYKNIDRTDENGNAHINL